MKHLSFNTNINCGGCIAGVKPVLDNLKGVIKWSVDTDDPSKILSLDTDDSLEAADIRAAVQSRGFEIEER